MNIIELCSLTVGLVALFVAFYSLLFSQIGVSASYQEEIRNWCGRCLAVMLKLKLQAEHKQELLAELSALIDEGRFFFPNIFKNDYGQQKLSAFQGLRSHILDYLVLYYQLYSSESNIEISDAETIYSEFLSEVFDFLNPAEFRKMLNKALNNAYAHIISREGNPRTMDTITNMRQKYGFKY